MNRNKQQTRKHDFRPVVFVAVALAFLIFHYIIAGAFQTEETSQHLDDEKFVWLSGKQIKNGGLYSVPAAGLFGEVFSPLGIGNQVINEAVLPPYSSILVDDLSAPVFQKLHPAATIFFFQPLPINDVDADLLISIEGVGPKLAQRIIDLRKKRGRFDSVEDLLEVKGIGPQKIVQWQDSFSFD